MKIQESAENYLESILILQKRKGHVRSIDIVNYLDFSKPSVSVAMKNLRENGFIHMEDGFITLTEKGLEIALPEHDFPDNDPPKQPVVNWRSTGQLIFSNWLNYYVYQSTPYMLKDI